MQFNQAALDSKLRFLDGILAEPQLLEKVTAAVSGGGPARVALVPRPWNPGGGATLFWVTLGSGRYFLKVKHTSVTVESKLEAEPGFSAVPSLRNEFEFCRRLSGQTPHVPRAQHYLEESGYGFLFLEPLAPFSEVAPRLSAAKLVDVYRQIEAAAALLHRQGIVHTDIHEHNVLFRGQIPVLADFEEAREWRQAVPFEESLDVIGITGDGDVGEMPSGDGRLAGRTCLQRLREVFVRLIRPKLDDLVKACNFDSSCPFLTALDHGQDERIYQSISLPGLTVAGQRPLCDRRVETIARVAETLFDRPFTHLDIGSNLGRFNLELAGRPMVKKSIGIEAHDTYVEFATVLAFLGGIANAEFFRGECGRDSVADLLRTEQIDLVTIYSVYHHIKDKRGFLRDLKRLNPAHVMFEWAVQPDCYEGRSWQEEMSLVCRELDMPYAHDLGESEDYHRPVVLLSREEAAGRGPAPAVVRPGESDGAGATPRMSVVLPTYNHLEFLPRAVQSLLDQTYRDFELIIVNDGSTDGTQAFLESLKDPRIRVINQANQRLPRALNAGFSAARGELLTWVSADNCAAPVFLEALAAALDGHPDAGLAYSAFAWINEGDQITGIHRDQDFTYYNMLAQNPGNASFLYRRRCQDRVGLYDPELEGAEDWDMWVRIVEQFPTVYVPEILYYYRLHERSMTVQQRDRIARSSRHVFVKALARNHGRLSLPDLFPSLAECSDRAAAEFHACLHFGTCLLRSPFGLVEPAVDFLKRAHARRPSSLAAAANLAVAYGRAGQWTDALRLAGGLAAAGHPEARAVGSRIAEAHRQGAPALLGAVPLFSLNASDCELLLRESQRKRLYAFTDQLPAPDGPPPAVVPAPEHNGPAEARPAEPLVSVIVPTFDRPDTLITAVTSVLNQTYQNIEIIVVNDAGADVESLVSFLDRDGRITYIRHGRNRGLAAARNTGIGAARGKYLAYLDDDDRFYSDHVATLVAFLEGGAFRAAYTDAHRACQALVDGRYVTTAKDVPYSHDFDPHGLLVMNYFPVLCMMHARSCLDEVGRFDETLTTHEDWDLWIRLSRRFPFAHLKQVTAEFTWREDGTSMTSRIRSDYLRTAEIIYRKYRSISESVPGLLEAQRRQLEGLRRRTADHAYACSIIIPVFNKAELTSQCLMNLVQATTDIDYEVVLVDNGSTDDTASVLAALSGDVQIIRNADNLGFARACNQGARAARGRYLVFLNNDTIPQCGWLTALVAEVESHPDVAVVGSRLLYPDGTVQHAGVGFSRIWFAPYHVYGGFPGDAEAVTRRREFQAVTAACMLVRRHIFEELGGFDEGYHNGFEDVDLCLRVRERGGRIVYQPQSVLIHVESQTPGRKQHETENEKRFLERWGGHWWLPDEDAIYVPDGYAVRTQAADGTRQYQLVRIETEAERACWNVVVEVQRAAQARDQAGLLTGLSAGRPWPHDATVLRWAAQLCDRIGIPDRAEWFWHEALQCEETGEARVALARAALNRGDLEEAGENLKRLHASMPAHAEGWLLQGILAMQRQQYAEADEAFSKAECHGADLRKAGLGVVMASLGRGEPHRAWEAALKLAADAPDDPEVLHWLVRAGTAVERWHDMVERLSEYVARNPADTAARVALAGVLLRLDERELAGQECRRLRVLDPQCEGLEELQKAVEAASADERESLPVER